jgi:hypothetical protein
MPACRSRVCSQSGLGAAGSIPRTTRVTNRSQPGAPWTGASSTSSTAKAASVVGGIGASSEDARPRSVKAAPVEWWNSRATPRIEKQ